MNRTTFFYLGIFAVQSFVAPVSNAFTANTEASLCIQAAEFAAQKSSVPVEILRAITLTETGHNVDGAMRSWPWAVNADGKGKWFQHKSEAVAFAKSRRLKQALNFDVGCFQINYRWHGKAFASLDDMFDPQKNATYAAGFLTRLYAEKGVWLDAAAAFHSRTPRFADRYRKRVESFLNEDALLNVDSVSTVSPKINSYPFLNHGARPPVLGSLVPMNSARPAPWFE